MLQARADLSTAEANAGLAKTNSTRYQGLLTQNAVSKQDTDTFVSQAASTSSTVESAQANVQRLEQLQSFEKIYAPFSGVITARGVDVGQLINGGNGTELFRISALNVLRVYVNVPQLYSQSAVPGTLAQLTLSEFPGQTFTGKLVRTAKAIDPASRTLLVEIDVDNKDGKLMPGAYAQVHLAVRNAVVPMIIPVSALIFRSEGLQVGTVVKGSNGDQSKLVHVVLGQDDGSTVQVIHGLESDSQVIQNPPDSLIDGEPVHVIDTERPGNRMSNIRLTGASRNEFSTHLRLAVFLPLHSCFPVARWVRIIISLLRPQRRPSKRAPSFLHPIFPRADGSR